MGNSTCTCDECTKEFQIELKTKRLHEGVELTYFNCPHCECEYTTYYTDTNIREGQRHVQRLREKLQGTKNLGIRERIHADIQKRQKEIAKQMDELKKKCSMD